MKKLRVLTLMHEDLIPPEDLTGLSEKRVAEMASEYDVMTALEHLGHEVRPLGVRDELLPLRKALEEWKPDIVFNLLEEFLGFATYDHNVISYLELMRTPYTGNNPRGMVIARDKALTKKILHFHRIRTPRFVVVPRGRRPRRPKHLRYPLIVKSVLEEASTGIAQASVVTTDEQLTERVRFMHQNVTTDAIVEEYIDGREIYSSVVGNRRLEVLPAWEIRLDNLPPDAHRIATHKVKWDLAYQEQHGIRIGPARNLGPELRARIAAVSRRAYRALGLSGYARLDFRFSDSRGLYVLEANPNPDISRDEELASSAEAAGYSYEKLIQKVVNLGLRRVPAA